MSQPEVTYVVGFAFSEEEFNEDKYVVLIRKNKPAWQAGRYNGVGGKIEPGESAREAMVREFREETGLTVVAWRQFAALGGEGFSVVFFRSFIPLKELSRVQSMTKELVDIRAVCDIKVSEVIPNLTWLIPMALYVDYEISPRKAKGFAIKEVY